MSLNGAEFSFLSNSDDLNDDWKLFFQDSFESPLEQFDAIPLNNELQVPQLTTSSLPPLMPLAPSLQIKQEVQEREEAPIDIESVPDVREFDEKPQSKKKNPQNKRKKAYKLDESAAVEDQIKILNDWINEYKIKLSDIHLDIDLETMDEKEVEQEKLRVRQQKNTISAQLSRWRKKLDYLSTQKTESTLALENESLKKRVNLLEREKSLLIIQNDHQSSEILSLKRELALYRQQEEASVDIRVSGSPRKGFLLQYQTMIQEASDAQRKAEELPKCSSQEKVTVSFG